MQFIYETIFNGRCRFNHLELNGQSRCYDILNAKSPNRNNGVSRSHQSLKGVVPPIAKNERESNGRYNTHCSGISYDYVWCGQRRDWINVKDHVQPGDLMKQYGLIRKGRCVWRLIESYANKIMPIMETRPRILIMKPMYRDWHGLLG